ncbi:alpha/beta fold hydrolase [Nocardiopsis sp. FIRDI 009]|uniref:alpha/beta fold hydrolase n=1 Tax=Nocardiopsis sp. FIRDI 009 TaxID=714197 RepID=UPI000E21D539|nr:alpha/beta fold hydrolase [Nocardiopsis sp. FIRDI 009]
MPAARTPDTLVLGATGLIGRHLVAELLRGGRTVAAATRGGPRREALLSWLRDRGLPTDRLTTVRVDATRPGLGLDADDARTLESVRDVHNCAAVYRFGMGRQEARTANVDSALHVLAWAARLPGLRRLVHVTGYRAGAPGLTATDTDRLYREHGAYEASKIEADTAVRDLAEREGLPLTVVNPSTVIGDSVTGESGQYIGLAETIRDLWLGRLPLAPGGPATFVPVVTVDHLARFLAAVPEHDTGGVRAHWVLDESTPNLRELLDGLARHLGVRPPRGSVPVGLLRRLPRAVTRTEPETLTFLSDDRYDTASANALAAAAGLTHPPVWTSLTRWADRLVSEGFGALPDGVAGGLRPVAGTRTYLTGDRVSPSYVLLHGLPLDGESWRPVADLLDAPVLVPDLPGLGRSGPSPVPDGVWLGELLGSVVTRPVLVGHSAGCAPLVRYAHAHPERVGGLVLVAPAFLQGRSSGPGHARPLVRAALPRLSAERLRRMTGVEEHRTDLDRVVASAVLGLRRPGSAARVARTLSEGRRTALRTELRALLASCPVPVTVVAGEHDPVETVDPRHRVVRVPGAGHHPHLVDPRTVAETVAEAGAGQAAVG